MSLREVIFVAQGFYRYTYFQVANRLHLIDLVFKNTFANITSLIDRDCTYETGADTVCRGVGYHHGVTLKGIPDFSGSVGYGFYTWQHGRDPSPIQFDRDGKYPGLNKHQEISNIQDMSMDILHQVLPSNSYRNPELCTILNWALVAVKRFEVYKLCHKIHLVDSEGHNIVIKGTSTSKHTLLFYVVFPEYCLATHPVQLGRSMESSTFVQLFNNGDFRLFPADNTPPSSTPSKSSTLLDVASMMSSLDDDDEVVLESPGTIGIAGVEEDGELDYEIFSSKQYEHQFYFLFNKQQLQHLQLASVMLEGEPDLRTIEVGASQECLGAMSYFFHKHWDQLKHIKDASREFIADGSCIIDNENNVPCIACRCFTDNYLHELTTNIKELSYLRVDFLTDSLIRQLEVLISSNLINWAKDRNHDSRHLLSWCGFTKDLKRLDGTDHSTVNIFSPVAYKKTNTVPAMPYRPIVGKNMNLLKGEHEQMQERIKSYPERVKYVKERRSMCATILQRSTGLDKHLLKTLIGLPGFKSELLGDFMCCTFLQGYSLTGDTELMTALILEEPYLNHLMDLICDQGDTMIVRTSAFHGILIEYQRILWQHRRRKLVEVFNIPKGHVSVFENAPTLHMYLKWFKAGADMTQTSFDDASVGAPVNRMPSQIQKELRAKHALKMKRIAELKALKKMDTKKQSTRAPRK